MYYTDLNTLVWKNFIGMLKRGETSSLIQIKDDPKKLLALLKSVGANEELLSKPAHREELEKYLKSILDYSISSVRDEDGLELERTDEGVRFHYENSHFQEDSSLSFEMQEDDDLSETYLINIKQNVGTKSRVIEGKSDSIKELIETESMCFPITTTRQVITRTLDDIGFICAKTVITGVKSKNNIDFKTRKLTRNGLDITIMDEDADNLQKEITKDENDSSKARQQKRLKWNGIPEDINLETSDSKEFIRNMIKTIEKYPQTKEYYEGIVGKDAIDIVLKLKKERRR